MRMPMVNECEADACAYNRERTCHALAITVGESRHAQCDTFVTAPISGGDPKEVGHVGACKMSDCEHNVELECQAPSINVGYRITDIHCLTYSSHA
jgi:hypothetical protein